MKGKGTANQGTGPGGPGGGGQRKSLRWPSPRCPLVATRRLRTDRAQPCRSACAPRRSAADTRTRPAACLPQQSRTPAAAPHRSPSRAQPSAPRRPSHFGACCSLPRPPAPARAPGPSRIPLPTHPSLGSDPCAGQPSPWILGHPPLGTRLRSSSVPSTPGRRAYLPAERGQRSRVTRAAAAAEQDRSPGPTGPPQRAPRHGSRERSPPGPPLQTRAQEERLALWSAVHLPRSPPKRLALRVNPEEAEEAILIKS